MTHTRMSRGASQCRLSRNEAFPLRRGDASRHALTGHRSLAQVKARERWRADCSVQRYTKEA